MLQRNSPSVGLLTTAQMDVKRRFVTTARFYLYAERA